MDYETLFPGRFIKSADLKGREVTLVIKSIKAEEIDGKPKAVVGFHGTKMEWVVNRTNAESIKLMFGRETNDWIGKKVTIFPDTVADHFNGGTTSAIRVKGSPDITKPATATVQRGRKSLKVSVVPTGQAIKANGKKPPKAAPEPPPPEMNEDTGEIPFGDDDGGGLPS